VSDVMIHESGAIGGTVVCRENLSTQRKPAPGPFSPPQAAHDQTWERTPAAAVGSRITACSRHMTRPSYYVLITQFQIMTLLI
jgi:hypothetical protein